MNVKANGEQLLARIGFANRWLDRAREQCAAGNVTRSVLTLVLADAEVHHALEAVGGPARVRTRRSIPVVLVLAAALASALLLAWRWPMDAGTVTSAPAPPVVRLSSASGALLEAMVPSRQMSAGQTIAPAPAPRRAPVAAGEPLEASRVISAPGEPGGRLTVGGGSVHVSMSELIDLMLTAERVLRREPAGASSP